MSSEALESYLASSREKIDQTLDRHLRPGATRPAVIHEAMRYAVLGGGKRVRPILAMAAAEAADADPDALLRSFAALELIHTYSLVHDDLPSLDDDDLRRGRPTVHVRFGESTAILTGDALLTEAFVWLAEPIAGVDAGLQLQSVALIARAIDSEGMIGGQVADLQAESRNEELRMKNGELLNSGVGFSSERLDEVEFIHRNKTGQLITASVLLGGILGGASTAEIGAMRTFGESIGLAFQIVDDLLDLEETAASLGKTAGKDLAQGKLTYPGILGVDRARIRVDELLEKAGASADMIGPRAGRLRQMAHYLCRRRN